MTDRESKAARRASAARRRAEAALERKTGFARVAMIIDRLTIALWPLFTAVIAFFAAAALDLFGLVQEFGGDGARFGLLAAFALGALSAAIHAYNRFSTPSRAEARARLDEGRPDRPVASFDEDIALGRDDSESEALWKAHQEQVAAKASKVRAPKPALKVGGRRDPWALRFFALLGLGAAYLLAPDEAGLRAAFMPASGGGVSAPKATLEIWASPPAYTGAPPIYFQSEADRFGARQAPVGTVISVRVFDAPGTPALTLEPAPEGPEAPALRDEGEGVYAAEVTLEEDARLTLVSGRGLGRRTVMDLRFEAIPDQPPSASFVSDPRRGEEGELTFGYTASDDYGVAAMKAVIILDPEAPLPFPPDPQDPIEFELAIPLEREADELAQLGEEEPGEIASEIFIGHPWVGLPVVATLYAEDALGQVSESAPARFELPGRLFSEPMAKTLIEQRAAISWSVERAARANRILMAAVKRPWNYFQKSGDYLVTRYAIDQLDNALTASRVAEKKTSILGALYAAAERLEDVGLDNLRERLERAQRRLREAIENGASPEEIAQLMQELRDAIRDYMTALRDLAEQNPELAERLEGQQGQRLSGDQLREMLRALEEAARNGDAEAAEQMLAMLEQLLNNMQPGGRSQQAGEGGDQDQQQGQSELDELQDMIERQQRLAEESFDQFQNGQQQQGQQGQQAPQQGPNQGQQQPGQQGQQGQAQQQPGQQGQQGQQGQNQQGQNQNQPGQGQPNGQRAERGLGGGQRSLDQLRSEQQALRDALGRLRDRIDDAGVAAGADGTPEERERRRRALDEAERSLDRAEEAMGRAEGALRNRDPGTASDEQMRAADAMRDGGRYAREALRPRDEEERQLADGEEDGQDAAERRRAEEGFFGDRNTNNDPLGRDRSPSPQTGADGDGGALRRLLGVDGENISPSRAREILDELRRRLGDRERSPAEREYLERLIERFR